MNNVNSKIYNNIYNNSDSSHELCVVHTHILVNYL